MEKEEGPSIATRYQITAYPTLLWLDPNGSIKNNADILAKMGGNAEAGAKAFVGINKALKDSKLIMNKNYNLIKWDSSIQHKRDTKTEKSRR
jgi:hypothetical protein